MAYPAAGRFLSAIPANRTLFDAVNHTVSLDGDDVELGLVNMPKPPADSDLRWQLLWREKLFAVCAPAYVEKRAACRAGRFGIATLLHDETEMANERKLNWQTWLAHYGVCRDEGAHNLFFTQSDLALQAAIAGQGVALARNSLAIYRYQKRQLLAKQKPLSAAVRRKKRRYICGRRDVCAAG